MESMKPALHKGYFLIGASRLMHPATDLSAIIATLPLIPYKQACYRIVDFATLTKFAPMMPLYLLSPGVNGQRYTPKGGPSALYMAEDPVTALAEYNRVERVVLGTGKRYNIEMQVRGGKKILHYEEAPLPLLGILQ